MKRQEIRKLKRAVAERKDVDAMHALLLRSVRLGHRRLALLRCIQAEQMGLQVARGTIEYCREVAATMSPIELESLMRHATGSRRFLSPNSQSGELNEWLNHYDLGNCEDGRAVELSAKGNQSRGLVVAQTELVETFR